MASTNRSSTGVKDQRASAREKARAMQDAQRRKDRRTRALIISAGVVLAAILITIAVIAITTTRATNAADQANLTQVTVPDGITDTGGITVPAPTGAAAPVRVEEYLDYQCPACRQFDATVTPYLEDQVAQGTVQLDYHPLGNLDQLSSGTRYSTRSANAAYCLAATGSASIATFTDALYAQQPPENGNGLPDADLIKAATDAGAPDDIAACITGETHSGYVAQQTTKASVATPTVIVDGTTVDNPTLANVQAAITAAQQ